MIVRISKSWYTPAFASIIFLIVLPPAVYPREGARHGAINKVSLQHWLYEKCGDEPEGYTVRRSGQDITCHSIRTEVQEALIEEDPQRVDDPGFLSSGIETLLINIGQKRSTE